VRDPGWANLRVEQLCLTGQQDSGEGGIRTLERVSPLTVFETVKGVPQATSRQTTYDDAENRLASCLAFLASKPPDLALIVERWDTLPEAVKAGIVAMLKAV
jgi:hypothetical protein